MNNSWPSNFEDLFGAISDDSFRKASDLDYEVRVIEALDITP